RPLVVASVVGLTTWVSVAAAKATPIVQQAAPLSYVIAALLVGAAIATFLRALLGSNTKRRRIPRVERWYEYHRAPIHFAAREVVERYEATTTELSELQAEYDLTHGAILGRVWSDPTSPARRAENVTYPTTSEEERTLQANRMSRLSQLN